MVNLALNELVPDFFQGWEVRILLLVYHEHHSSARRRDGGSLFFSVIEAGPFEIRVANEVSLTVSNAIRLYRIMAPCCIWPDSGVALRSLHFAFEVFGVIIQRIIL